MDIDEVVDDLINERKEMLDDSNSAKEIIDQVKRDLKKLLNSESKYKLPKSITLPNKYKNLTQISNNIMLDPTPSSRISQSFAWSSSGSTRRRSSAPEPPRFKARKAPSTLLFASA